MENKKIGILNKGKNNIFIKNTFENLEIGIQDEGEGTYAEDNKFLNQTDKEKRDKDDEIIKLSPELYGVGINLKILYRKIKNSF